MLNDDISNWEILTKLINSKSHNKSFWEFVERLKKLKLAFNRVVDRRLRLVPRHLRRKPTIIALFAGLKKQIYNTEEKIELSPVKHESNTSDHHNDTLQDDFVDDLS
jgi:hypothetical protein